MTYSKKKKVEKQEAATVMIDDCGEKLWPRGTDARQSEEKGQQAAS